MRKYKTLAGKTLISGESIRSDISLTVLTSNRNPNYEVVYKDAFPIRVTGLDFNTTSTDIDYIESSATFRYVTYDITKVS